VICHAKQTSSALGLPDLVNFLSELHALKVDLLLKTQGIGTTSPSGKAMFGMLPVFADFERSIIQNESAPASAGSGGF
jgi:DNA invertase Pin-like site-specific DNA recombinase